MVTHGLNLGLELVLQVLELVLKPSPEGLQGVINTLLLSLREVTIRLNLALDVLELRLELLLRLYALHEHDVVVTVHLDELVIHGGQGHVFILLSDITCHVFLDELLLGRGHTLLHHRVAGRNERS